MANENSLRDELFQLVHGLYRAEIDVPIHNRNVLRKLPGFDQVEFEGNPEVFGGFIALSPLELQRGQDVGTEEVSSVKIGLDDGDAWLELENDTVIDAKDPYAEWFAAQLRAVVRHPHEICEAALRKEQAMRKAGTQLARLRSAVTGQEILR